MAAYDNSGNINNSFTRETFSGETGTSEYSHLIELTFEENNYIIAGEAIVYSTDANTSENFVLWLPENADIMQFQATDMMASVASTPVNYSREANLVYFSPPLHGNTTGMPLLYGLRYSVHSHEEIPTFHKVLREEDIFGYPISRLILIVNHESNEIPSVISAEGKPIVADEVSSEADQTSYLWYSPEFTEINVILESESIAQTSEDSSNPLIIPGILAIIIIGAAIVYYKMYHKKQNPDNISELQDIYDAEMAVISQIKEDRKKKKLSKEEFDSILKKHTDNASKIKNKIEKQKRT
ncbi:MAG: hypothetical protein R2741_01250 [Methanolobus sp.]